MPNNDSHDESAPRPVTIVRLTTKYGVELSVFATDAAAQDAVLQLIDNRMGSWEFDDQQKMLKAVGFEQQLELFHELEAGVSDGYQIEFMKHIVR